MLIIKQGNLLHAPEDIIAHQVNCRGVMGAGVARQIKQCYRNSYVRYVNHARKTPDPLGTCCITYDNGKIIAHLFGQDGYGRNKVQTDLAALERAFIALLDYARPLGLSIAIPFQLGCGLAGGDWRQVRAMIDHVSGDTPIMAYQL